MVIEHHRDLPSGGQRVVAGARLRVDQRNKVLVIEMKVPRRRHGQFQLPNHRAVLCPADDTAESDPRRHIRHRMGEFQEGESAGERIRVGVVVGQDEQPLASLDRSLQLAESRLSRSDVDSVCGDLCACGVPHGVPSLLPDHSAQSPRGYGYPQFWQCPPVRPSGRSGTRCPQRRQRFSRSSCAALRVRGPPAVLSSTRSVTRSIQRPR